MNIKLSHEKTGLIDIEDRDLAGLKWHVNPCGSKESPLWYVRGAINGKHVYLHRLVMERVLKRKLGRNDIVDHINGNGLDDRRENLRLSSHSQNHANQKICTKKKYSKYRGVCWSKRAKKWTSSICMNYKSIHLGCFISEKDAAKAYDVAAIEMFGKYAVLNFDVMEAD